MKTAIKKKEKKKRKTRNEWAWLCSHKTLFTYRYQVH